MIETPAKAVPKDAARSGSLPARLAVAVPMNEWRSPVTLTVLLILAVVPALFASTTRTMVSTWYRSDTFAHGFIVVPIFLYLMWRKRELLATLTPRPFLPALPLLALAGLAWLLADRLVVNSAAQLAMVSMVPLAVWVVLGTRVLHVLAFPLAFLFFAVPLGEFMIPQLIDWTARFTVFALRVSGVPVLVEGNLLTVPTGSWAIVEACSGIRYLIASVMIGFLFAYLSYRSTRRRLVFIGASVVVPIIANWLRAYLIVLLGHLTNNRLAAGVDHLIYGWIFFGIVMGLLFWIGGKWREDEPAVEAPAPRAQDRSARPPGVRPSVALLAVAAVIVVFPVLAHVVWRTGAQVDAATLDAVAGANGWSADAVAFTTWRPEIEGASAELTQGFVKNGARVGVHVAYFPRTTPTSKAITTANELVHPGNPIWRRTDSRTFRATIDGATVTAPLDTIARPSQGLAVTRWFWVDGRIATREIVAKVMQLVPALRGRPDSVAWVVVYSPAEPGTDAAPVLESFVRDMSPAIDAVVARAAGAH